MATTANIRKSNRLSKADLNKSEEQRNGSQSRITEFVNVKKRGSGLVDQLPQKQLQETMTSEKSACSTPVKIKRKTFSGVIEEVKKTGVLTPSPSVESISDEAEKDGRVIKGDLVNGPLVIESIVFEHDVKEHEERFTKELDDTFTTRTEAVKKPAYKRFAHLVEEVRNQKPKTAAEIVETQTTETTEIIETRDQMKYVPWLPIGEKWAIYEKIIFNVDNLCVLAAGRSQPCIYHKIQKTLENVLGRQVPIDQLERIKTLWPEAYEYREAKCVMAGKRVESVAVSVPGIGTTESSAALLNERREQVRGRVQRYLIQEHKKAHFADDTTVDGVPKQWHEKFDLSAVADIPRSKLVESTVNESVTVPRMIDEIISSTASPRKPVATSGTLTVTAANQPTAVQPQSLIERIRAKEQALHASKCFGSSDPETARLQAILSQMDRFTQSLMFTFTSSKKTSLFLTDLTQKLVQSSKTALSGAEVLEMLKMLERAAPEWIKIVDGGDSVSVSASASISSDSTSNTSTSNTSASNTSASNIYSLPRHVKILDKSRSLSSILESLQRSRQQ